jgi:hypothetical protein
MKSISELMHLITLGRMVAITLGRMVAGSRTGPRLAASA